MFICLKFTCLRLLLLLYCCFKKIPKTGMWSSFLHFSLDLFWKWHGTFSLSIKRARPCCWFFKKHPYFNKRRLTVSQPIAKVTQFIFLFPGFSFGQDDEDEDEEREALEEKIEIPRLKDEGPEVFGRRGSHYYGYATKQDEDAFGGNKANTEAKIRPPKPKWASLFQVLDRWRRSKMPAGEEKNSVIRPFPFLFFPRSFFFRQPAYSVLPTGRA